MLSVILPTYNRRHLLPRCIDSILSQDFTNFELLIIDDGSTDETLEFLQRYTDPRIQIFQKENGGVSSARNLGIQKARGKYLTFIDSDDFILQGFFTDAKTVLEEKGLDALFYGGICKRWWKTTRIPTFWARQDDLSKDYQNHELFRDFCLFFGNSWGCAKFFKTELIHRHNILFDEAISYGEDLIFVLQFLLFAPCVGMRNEAFYCCDVRGESLCRGQVNRNRKIEGLLLGYDKIYQMLLKSSRENLILNFNTLMIEHLDGVYYGSGMVIKNGAWESRFMELCCTKDQRMGGIYKKIRNRCYKLPPYLGIPIMTVSHYCLFLTYGVTRRVAAKVLPKKVKKKLRQWRDERRIQT